MNKIFEFNVAEITQILGSAVILYILIILYIRIYGKRSISELNNFDWIVTVTVGSLFASTVILKDVSVIEGAISIFILMVLQFIITKMMSRSEYLTKAVKSTPKLLFFEGEFITENMRNERIMESEVFAAIRRNGYKPVKKIYAVVLETNSMMSVIPNDNTDDLGYSLHDVQGLPDKLKLDLEMQKEAGLDK